MPGHLAPSCGIGGCEGHLWEGSELVPGLSPTAPHPPPGRLRSGGCRGAGQPEHSQDICQLRTLSDTKTVHEGSQHRPRFAGSTGGHRQHSKARNSASRGWSRWCPHAAEGQGGAALARLPCASPPPTDPPPPIGPHSVSTGFSHSPPTSRPLGAHRPVPGQCTCSVHFPGPSPTESRCGGRRGTAAPVGRGVADTPAARCCALLGLLRAVAAGGGLVHLGPVSPLAGGCWSQGWAISGQAVCRGGN